ncbi:MAG: hypothetical protein M2R45_03668 [Verrucomicrobia subdivision 3 bacterium]|nr:hypothetical protein [Limisphaerales bacterium]MCS1412703.1 hypothetical protein [Limisphaerales bacterium]
MVGETEESTQWWQDRIAWIDETADKLHLTLGPNNTGWTEEAAAYHQSLHNRYRDLRQRSSIKASPTDTELETRSRQFQQDYVLGRQKACEGRV